MEGWSAELTVAKLMLLWRRKGTRVPHAHFVSDMAEPSPCKETALTKVALTALRMTYLDCCMETKETRSTKVVSTKFPYLLFECVFPPPANTKGEDSNDCVHQSTTSMVHLI